MSYDSLPMRKDPIFNVGGNYELVIGKNICFHREATEKALEVSISWSQALTDTSKPLKILDLACGGKPLIPSAIMQRLSHYQFIYTGIDLNQDQIDACKKYPFSKNVSASIMEGNIWELNELKLVPPYDIVFMGLNSHHAVPEEILYAAKDIYKILKPNGIFLNHDLFRPSKYPYLRRPEPLGFVSQEKLKFANIATPLSPTLAGNKNSPWREDWLTVHKGHLLANGYSEEEAARSIAHMRERDWPISLKEMAELLKKVGFKTETYHYQDIHYPLPEFFALVMGIKR